MDLQKMMDAVAAAGMSQRSNYHLTVGGLVSALSSASRAMQVVTDDGRGVYDPESYRGYYSDVSLNPKNEPGSVADLLAELNSIMGTELTGYKGGEFLCTPDKPLWVSSYGSASGVAITGYCVEGDKFILETRQIE